MKSAYFKPINQRAKYPLSFPPAVSRVPRRPPRPCDTSLSSSLPGTKSHPVCTSRLTSPRRVSTSSASRKERENLSLHSRRRNPSPIHALYLLLLLFHRLHPGEHEGAWKGKSERRKSGRAQPVSAGPISEAIIRCLNKLERGRRKREGERKRESRSSARLLRLTRTSLWRVI